MDSDRQPLLQERSHIEYNAVHTEINSTDNLRKHTTINDEQPFPDVAIEKVGGDDNVTTKLYKRRWYMLFIFSMIAFVQGGIWNTWGPIAAASEEAFNWTDADIALFANWGCISYLVACFPMAWIIDVKGGFLFEISAFFSFRLMQ